MRREARSLPSQPSTLSALAIIGRSAKTEGLKRSGRMASRYKVAESPKAAE